MTPVRAIFFDIGDTLVFDDPPLPERLKASLCAAGVFFDDARWPAAYRKAEAIALCRYLTVGRWDDADGQRELLDALGVVPDGIPPAALIPVPFTRRVAPGALELLRELRQRGFAVGAISDWEDTLPALLAELELAAHFDAVAVSALVGVTKPNPRLFQAALRQTNLAPEETLHVGDWYELDVCGARAAGMNALLFDHQGRCPHADCVRVTTFSELSDWLLALSAPSQAVGPLSVASRHLSPASQEKGKTDAILHPLLRSGGGSAKRGTSEDGEGAANAPTSP